MDTCDTCGGEIIFLFGTALNNEQQNGKPVWPRADLRAGLQYLPQEGGRTRVALIAFGTASSYVDTLTGAAASYTYKVACRGVRATDEGGMSPELSGAAGGEHREWMKDE